MKNINWIKTKDELPQGKKRGLFSKERIVKVWIKDKRGEVYMGCYQEKDDIKRFTYLKIPEPWMNPELHTDDWRIVKAKKWAYR